MSQRTLFSGLCAKSTQGLASASCQHQMPLLLAHTAILFQTLQHRLQVFDLLAALNVIYWFGVRLRLVYLSGGGVVGDVLLGMKKLALFAKITAFRASKECARFGLGLILWLLILHQYYKLIVWRGSQAGGLQIGNFGSEDIYKSLQFGILILSMEKEKINELPISYQEYENRGKSLSQVIIDKYVIYDEIGKGSYGKVYRGMDDQTKKQVAVKVIDLQLIARLPEGKQKKTRMKLAETEPELMQICDSNYVLKCYNIYKNNDLKVLILEFCNGKTLEQEIREKRNLPENEAIIIIRHIINGLMEMHRHKIVHRDLKPDNIMSHNGTYKIIDLGFSKKLEISQESMEVKGTALGTITTMAPEVMSKQPYGLKADIWSLGIIFFYMIYGVMPYDSLTAKERYNEISQNIAFSSKEPPKLKGITPSQSAYDFMRFLIVVDSKNRPNWKQVSEHPLIRNVDDEFMCQRFLKQCEVNPNSDLNCEETLVNDNSAVLQVEPEVTEEFKGFLDKLSGISGSKKQKSDKQSEKNSPTIQKKQSKKQQSPINSDRHKYAREREEKEKQQRQAREKAEREKVAEEQQRQREMEVKARRQEMVKKEEIARQEEIAKKQVIAKKQEIARQEEKAKREEMARKEAIKRQEENKREKQRKEEMQKQKKAEEQLRISLKKREQLNKREQQERKEQEEKRRKEEEEQAKKIKVDRTVFKIETGQKKQPQKSAILVQNISKQQMNMKQKNLDNGENEQFAWASKAHLQCLKTQWIYRQIMMPIESGQWLHLKDRSTIEFMYLLTARCFNNMSPIQHELQVRKKNKEMINNLNEQITPLYKQVHAKFVELSGELTKMENKPLSIVSDFFSRNLMKREYVNKEKYLTGVEGCDYKKDEQIEFTHQYYRSKIEKVLSEFHLARVVMLKLDNYSLINSISEQKLTKEGMNFEQYVTKILKR